MEAEGDTLLDTVVVPVGLTEGVSVLVGVAVLVAV